MFLVIMTFLLCVQENLYKYTLDGYKFASGLPLFLRWLVPSPESHCHSENELVGTMIPLPDQTGFFPPMNIFTQIPVPDQKRFFPTMDIFTKTLYPIETSTGMFWMDGWMLLDTPPTLSFKKNLLPVSLLLWIFRQVLMARSTSVLHA